MNVARPLPAVLLLTLSGALLLLFVRGPEPPVGRGAAEDSPPGAEEIAAQPPALAPFESKLGSNEAHPGAETRRVAVERSEAREAPSEKEPWKGEGAWLSVRVQSPQPNPRPADGPRVTATDPWGVILRGEPAEPGIFLLGPLAPGVWTATASAPRHTPVHRELELGPGERRELEITLERSPALRILARTPEGLGLLEPGVWPLQNTSTLDVLASHAPLVLGPRPPLGASLGRFDARHRSVHDPDELGLLVLETQPPLFVSLVLGGEVIAVEWAPAGSRVIEFVVPADTLLHRASGVRGRVVQAGPGPVQALGTDVHWMTCGAGERPTDGRFEIAPLRPGPVFLRVPGHPGLHGPFELPPGAVLDVGALAPGPAHGISGRVLAPSGHPARAMLLLYSRRSDGALWPEPILLGASDGETGAFAFPEAPPGQWRLRATEIAPPGAHTDGLPSAAWELDNRAGPTDQNFTLEPTGILVVAHRGARLPGERLRLVPQRSGPRPATIEINSPVQRVTLVRGPWIARRIDADGSLVEERHFAIGAHPVRVEF